jgi:membrane-bound metal-dependent hydrolase YbcI (DUF457 family)
LHALLAAAVQGSICVVFVGQGINEFAFYAALVSIIVDLDHRSDEERSSAIHSLFTVSTLFIMCFTWIALTSDIASKMLAASILVGFTTHVLLDITDGEGIYVVPWKSRRIAPFHQSRFERPPMRGIQVILAVLSGFALLVLVCV